nr:ATP-binding cassette domain-containing protein [Pseudomonadota bacterium]
LSHGTVRFENVSFAYPLRPDVPVLQDLSLEVNAGETVAIVGPSGTGKTTVFQLLLRFYDPQQGRVLMNGVDIRQAGLEDARSRIGLVPQDPAIFSASARDNIRYGHPDATDEQVRRAVTAAYAAEFLDRLPQGLDTLLGQKGVALSAGQRQRISIARAILKNPEILLLDEATSALDAESEHVVRQALDILMEGRTTLIIAHRLATVMQADRILVMEQGRITASGRHGELMETSPLYARLVRLQFSSDKA